MFKLVLIICAICLISVLLLSIGVILRTDGKFRSLHIGQSPHMRSRGIHCVQSMDRFMRKDNPHRVPERKNDKSNKN